MLIILQEDAVNLLISLGAKEQLVRKWSTDKLTLKLKALKEVPPAEFEGLTGKEKETLDTVIASIDNKEKFRVGEPPAPRPKKVKTESEGEKKPERAKRAPKKPKKEPQIVDSFGMREGTGGAIINTVLSDRYPLKEKEILERCGVDTTRSRISGHMRKLKERGLVEKTKEGWVVKPGVITKRSKPRSTPVEATTPAEDTAPVENVVPEEVKEEVVTPVQEVISEPVNENNGAEECTTVEEPKEVNPNVVA